MKIRALIHRCLVLMMLISSLPLMATTFDEDNYTLLDLKYKRQTIMAGLETYIHQGSTYIVLIDLVSALELNITVDIDGATGFINTQDQTFSLENKQSQWSLTTHNETSMINANDIVIHEGFIFVKDTLIEDWFGLTFELKYALLILNFTTESPLPVLQRMKRSNRKIRSVTTLGAANNPLLETPYALLELPAIDFRSSSIVSRRKDKDVDTLNFYTLISHGDLGYMSTSLFLNGSHEEDLRNASIRMDRFDHRKSMFGPLKLSQISFGDLSHPSLALAPSSSGRGIIISNDISTQQSSRNITVIEGDFHPGQEVELYFNNSLIGYQIVPEDGHYIFKDIVLFLGNNHFVLKFYGINGTIETKHRNILVGSNPEDEKRLKYTLSISQPNTDVIDLNKEDDSEEEEYTQSVITTRYAFNRYLSFSAGYEVTEEYNEKTSYTSAGFQTAFFGTTLNANTSHKEGQLLGSSFSISARPFGAHLRIGTTIYDEIYSFQDPNIPSSDTVILEQDYSFALSARYKFTSYTFFGTRKDESIGYKEDYKLGISGHAFGLSWNNTNTYSFKKTDNNASNTGDPDNEVELLDGGLFFGRYINPFSLRLNLGYEVIPETQLKSVGLSFSFKPTAKASINTNISHNVIDDTTNIEISGSWKFKYAQITPRIQYDHNDNILALVDISTSLGKRNGRLGNYYNLDSKKRSSKGVIRARLFDDFNNNKTYDEGEDLLSGGIIVAQQYRSNATSDNSGIAWIEHTKSWVPTDIIYEPNTLNDTSMSYSGPDIAIVARPGKVINLDLPFTRTGDIDGTVYRPDDDTTNYPVRGAIVAALNAAGEVISRNRTDLDGYFSFTGLLPGHYHLVVQNEHIQYTSRLDAVITSAGDFIDNYNIVITEKKKQRIQFPGASKNTTSPFKKTDITPNTLNSKPSQPVTTASFPLPKVSPVLVNPTPTLLPQEKVKLNSAPAKQTPTQKKGYSKQYAIKFGSFSNPKYAAESINKLKRSGKSVYKEMITTPKGTFTRVLVGPFNSKQDAESSKKDIDRQYKSKGLVVLYKKQP
ncbi:MAG: hypothetical protein COA99_02180 [Moraxellaceae bacterium]|nr:MAG: hypothetical protein COA99_02180 [Moraxellaceae bacterium]